MHSVVLGLSHVMGQEQFSLTNENKGIEREVQTKLTLSPPQADQYWCEAVGFRKIQKWTDTFIFFSY